MTQRYEYHNKDPNPSAAALGLTAITHLLQYRKWPAKPSLSKHKVYPSFIENIESILLCRHLILESDKLIRLQSDLFACHGKRVPSDGYHP